MPETMLKKMLDALCSSGAEFCHPSQKNEIIPGTQPENLTMTSGFSDFAKDIPGGKVFQPWARKNQPYYPPERHPNYVEILLPVSGSVDFLINEKWHCLNEKKVHILLRNTIHTERCRTNGAYTLLWLISLPRSLTLHRTTYSPKTGYGQSGCRILIEPPMANQLWNCGSEDAVDESHYFSLLVQCLDYAVRYHLAERSTEDYHYSLVSQIKEYLDENFFQPVSLDELAQMGHYSRMHFNQLFVKQYGITVYQYMLKLRIDAAKRFLAEGMTPSETSRKVGFDDPRYFSRLFRQKTGSTPTEFQKTRHGKS